VFADLKEVVAKLVRDTIPQNKRLAPEDLARSVMTARDEADARMRAQALLDLDDHHRAETEYAEAVDHYRTEVR
jgi:hypothetical protein